MPRTSAAALTGPVTQPVDGVLDCAQGRGPHLIAPGPVAGALAEPQGRGQHLARAFVRPVIELPQCPGDHSPGDVLDRDGDAGQPRVQQAGRDAAVEAGDAEVAADPQPQFGGDPVDHGGQPVAAGHDGVRARTRVSPPPVRPGEQGPDLAARAGLVHEQDVGLVLGDAVAGQPGPEPGDPFVVPVVLPPVPDEGQPAEPPGQHVLDRLDDGRAVVDVDPVLRQCRPDPAEAGERDPGLGQQHHPRVLGLQFGEQEGVYRPAGDQAAHLVARVPVRDDDHHAVAPAGAHRRQCLQELLHDVVVGQQLDAGHDVGQLPRPARAQAPRAVVRVVSQSGHGLQHPDLGGLTHPAAVVEHVRDRLPTDARGPGHILNRYLTRGGRSGSRGA